jgi:uncharacterized cupredoxin-like copper-binding protein
MEAGLSDRTKFMIMWPVAGFLVVVAFGVGLISMAAFDSAEPTSSVGAKGAESAEVIEVELGDLYVKPDKLTASAGKPLVFEVSNAGATEHNFAIEGGPATDMIPPGGSTTLEMPALDAGDYQYICQVSGHAQGGMKGVLTVSGEGQSTNDEHADHGMSGMSAEKMVEVDAAVTSSFPAETKGLGGHPSTSNSLTGSRYLN